MTYSSAKTKHSNDYLISESIRRTVRNSSQGNEFDPSYGRLYYYVNPKNDKEIAASKRYTNVEKFLEDYARGKIKWHLAIQLLLLVNTILLVKV